MKLLVNSWGNGYENSGVITQVETGGEVKGVEFRDGEPEDFVIARDLNGAKRIKDLVIMAFEAGKRGEEITVEEISEEPQ